MVNPHKKDLSSIYPKQKSYYELEVDKKILAGKRRPKHVELKISLWSTLGIVVALVTYISISNLMLSNLDSGGGVIFGVSVSILIFMIATAIVYYLCSLIGGIVRRVFTPISILYIILLVVSGVTLACINLLAELDHANVLTILGVLMLNFFVLYFLVRYLIRK